MTRTGWMIGALGALLMPGVGHGAEIPKSRAFEFTYRCTIDSIPDGTRSLRLWLPVPTSGDDQEIASLTIDGAEGAEITQEGEYGNRMVTVGLRDPSGPISLGWTCRVLRREVGPPARLIHAESGTILARALRPDRLIPTGGKAAELAALASAGDQGVEREARDFYDWVLTEMTYDKSGTGWGRGDFAYACDARRGNCSDFHSYFIGLARARGIPAIFEIGFPLPMTEGEGEIKGYHCWAKFYDPDKGWTAVDISEADKDSSMAGYYFGHLTPNRIALSRGRDITLSPPQAGPPLNFFVYPYAEADGKPIEDVAWTASYRDS